MSFISMYFEMTDQIDMKSSKAHLYMNIFPHQHYRDKLPQLGWVFADEPEC